MVATVAADPSVALKPCDYLVSVGFRLRHGHYLMRKYMRIKIAVNAKRAIIYATQRASRAAWLVSLSRVWAAFPVTAYAGEPRRRRRSRR